MNFRNIQYQPKVMQGVNMVSNHRVSLVFHPENAVNSPTTQTLELSSQPINA